MDAVNSVGRCPQNPLPIKPSPAPVRRGATKPPVLPLPRKLHRQSGPRPHSRTTQQVRLPTAARPTGEQAHSAFTRAVGRVSEVDGGAVGSKPCPPCRIGRLGKASPSTKLWGRWALGTHRPKVPRNVTGDRWRDQEPECIIPVASRDLTPFPPPALTRDLGAAWFVGVRAGLRRGRLQCVVQMGEEGGGAPNMDGTGDCQEGLGGMLKYYCRRAA